jgi:hypothetical protein
VVAGLAFLIARPITLCAQETVADTSRVDSAYSRMIAGFGELSMMGGRIVASRDRWQWLPVRSVAQVLDGQAGRYLRSVGESGAAVGSSWLGGSSAHDEWLIDGLPAADPMTGRTNLALLPLEQQEAIEQLSDEEALLAGQRWNLVTRQFSTVRPLTAIRFVQEPDETILSDAFFTQNIARSTALTFGFQRHTSAGRFANAALDAWDLRGRVRANLSERANVAAFWHYGRSSRGVNGGVESAFSPSIFDEVSAVVVHSSAYEIHERSDLGVTGMFRLVGDSLSTTRISTLHRSVEREYRQFPDRFSSNEVRHFASAKDLLVSAEQRVRLPFLSFAGAAQIARTRIDSTEVFGQRDVARSRLSASAALTLLDWLIPRAGIALLEDDGENARSAAASVTLSPSIGMQATLSGISRPIFPTLQERFWSDSTVLRPRPVRRGEERLVSAGFSWVVDSALRIDITGFRRTQRDVVIARAAQTVHGTPSIALTTWSPTWSGVTASAHLNVFAFELSGSFTMVNVEVSDTLSLVLPRWWGHAELAFHDRIFRDQLGLHAGVRGRFSDRLRGLSPDPPTGFEVANTSTRIGRAVTIDLYGTMEIGKAFVTLSWENLANASTLRAAIYPMPERQFKLGVRWVFLD